MQLTALWFVSGRFCYEIQGLGPSHCPLPCTALGLIYPQDVCTSHWYSSCWGEWAENRGAQVTLQLGIAKSEVAVKKNTHLLLFTLCVHREVEHLVTDNGGVW